MGRKKEKIDKDGPFQTRFRGLCYGRGETQQALADEFGVRRSTIATWLDGKNIPNIYILEKIARHYGVSADYLLGLSDTESPDVSVRAAAEYTGLSEEAVKWLHIGLDDFACDGVGPSEQEKRRNQKVTSALIRSKAFTDMIHRLSMIAQEAYLEKLLTLVDSKYCDFDALGEDEEFNFSSTTDRQVVEAALIHAMGIAIPRRKESFAVEARMMDDEDLACLVDEGVYSAREKNELHQFHAAKAFTGYIDQVIRASHEKAEARFKAK